MADCDKTSSSGRRIQDVPLQFTKDFSAGGNTTLKLDALKDVPPGMTRYCHYIDITFSVDVDTAATTGAMLGADAYLIFANVEILTKGGAVYTGINGREIRLYYKHRAGAHAVPDPADLGAGTTTTKMNGMLRIPFKDPGTNPGDDTSIPVQEFNPSIKLRFGAAAALGTGVTINSVELDAVARVEDTHEKGLHRDFTVTTISQTTDTPSLPKGDYIAGLIIADSDDAEDTLDSTAVGEVMVPGVLEYPESFESLVNRWNADYARDEDAMLDLGGAEFVPVLFLPGERNKQSLVDTVGSNEGALTFKVISGTDTSPNVLVSYFKPTTRFDREMAFRRAYPTVNVNKEGGDHGLKPKTRSGKMLSLDNRAALSLRWKAVPLDEAERVRISRGIVKGTGLPHERIL
jgi:hypothetical protein